MRQPVSGPLRGTVTFDYSTSNGTVAVGHGDATVRVKFSKASNASIHLYQSDHGCKVARAKGLTKGRAARFRNFDSSSRSYTINLGEYFFANNVYGYTLLGRVNSIKDDSRGDDRDEVVFDYEIKKSETFKAF